MLNRVKSVMLMTLLGLILISIGGYVGGQNGATIMFIIALVLNFYSYWNSDKIILRAYNAKELIESQVEELTELKVKALFLLSKKQVQDLFSLVKELSRNAGIPMPRLYIIPTDVPNAFATGRNENHAAIAVTEGLISLLDRDEIAGVISHELSHIRHHDTLIMTLAATFATAISYLAQAAQWAAIFGGGRDNEGRSNNPFVLIATIVIAPLAASLIQMALSRSREFLADASGAEISGKPLALACALQKLDSYSRRKVIPHAKPTSSGLFIINPLAAVGGYATLFSTHPSTEERVKKLHEIAAQKNLF